MCDDREWTVRHAAIKSIVLVECGPKMMEGMRSDAWKPAGKRIMVSILDDGRAASRLPSFRRELTRRANRMFSPREFSMRVRRYAAHRLKQ